ncbi:MAG: hypothetical protein JO100_11350 [Pseudonocardia sp.]|nr:hypothetical protein [Pseudonocardia sp.]
MRLHLHEPTALVGLWAGSRAIALAEGNRVYERRFGHVYLVCADGQSAEELLDVLRARLGNDLETERRVPRVELAKINRLRLGRLYGWDRS